MNVTEALREVSKLQDEAIKLRLFVEQWEKKNPLSLSDAITMASEISLSWSFLDEKLQDFEKSAMSAALEAAKQEFELLRQEIEGGKDV